MNSLRWMAFAIAIQGMLPALALAEGWKMPNLNPLARKDSHPANLRLADHDEKSTWWKPKLPSLPASRSRARSQPSTWSKMTRGTKAAWAKTTDALNPFDDENDKPKAVTGYNTHFTQASTRKRQEKKSSWWPWSAEEPKRPQTVQDWMSQEMPY
ncbi:MAG TPA: hypothetical protein VMP01_11600 [Pirellulaceae bacterium]|nr:hypothetical protein [Pirellulaceae bacterium]